MREPQALKTRTYDYLVVGAGFAGSVLAERLARDANRRVLVIDRRSHIAGNAYDYVDSAGILVHKHGPHIFHTKSSRIFAYLSQFTEWRSYEHRVRAHIDGQLVPFPINLDTINQLYHLTLTTEQLESYFRTVAEPVEHVRTSEDIVVNKVGRDLYEKFFLGYTRKQWGMNPSELAASVTGRIPVRTSRDDRYFDDEYQAMPLHGYTRLFERMLDHANIDIMLNTDYADIARCPQYKHVIFTGPIDSYFGFCYGALPYRSLAFELETIDAPIVQPCACITYPNDHDYTRVTEFKHLTGQVHPRTTIAYEYPRAVGEPYYPIPQPETATLYQRYKLLARSVSNVSFVGRLATYRYYNMDQVVGQALAAYRRLRRGGGQDG